MDIVSTAIGAAIGAGIGLACSLITWYVTDVRHRKKQALRFLLFYLEHVERRLPELIREIRDRLRNLDQGEFYPSYDIPPMRTDIVNHVLEQWSPRTDRERRAVEASLAACETLEALEGRMKRGDITQVTLNYLEVNAQYALELVQTARESVQELLCVRSEKQGAQSSR